MTIEKGGTHLSTGILLLEDGTIYIPLQTGKTTEDLLALLGGFGGGISCGYGVAREMAEEHKSLLKFPLLLPQFSMRAAFPNNF